MTQPGVVDGRPELDSTHRILHRESIDGCEASTRHFVFLIATWPACLLACPCRKRTTRVIKTGEQPVSQRAEWMRQLATLFNYFINK